jgi:DNA repair protein RecO (recombination protein O)
VPHYKAEGVVLKKQECGESGEIVTLLAREQGKIKVFARGVRTLKGSLAGKLELLSTIRILASTGRSLDVCSQVQVLSPRMALRNNLIRVAYGLYYLELFDGLLHFSDSQEGLFSLLESVLDQLSRDEVPREQLSVHLVYRLLSRLGYGPVVDCCAMCGKNEGAFYFVSSLGGIVCPPCRRADALAGSIFLKEEEQVFLKKLPFLGSFPRSPEGEETSFNVRILLEDYVMYHFSKKIRASHFIQTLRGLALREQAKEKESNENHGA